MSEATAQDGAPFLTGLRSLKCDMRGTGVERSTIIGC